MKKKTIYNHIKETLATASQLIIAAPVRLPPRVVAAAKYVSLGVALLDAISQKRRDVACNVSTARNVSIGGNVSTARNACTKNEEDPNHGH